MRAEFFRQERPDEPLAEARWDGRRAVVVREDPSVEGLIARIFRPAPVVVDDPSLLPQGSRGTAAVQPGALDWFLAAAGVRAGAEGVRVRFVPEARPHAGWDPAANYRTFREQMRRVLASPLTDQPA